MKENIVVLHDSDIGVLDLMIVGEVKAGLKEIFYHKDNEVDYNDFISKNSLKLDNVKFTNVDNIRDVINIIML